MEVMRGMEVIADTNLVNAIESVAWWLSCIVIVMLIQLVIAVAVGIWFYVWAYVMNKKELKEFGDERDPE